MAKKIKIYMGLPTTGTVCDFQAYMLRELQERYSDAVELVYPSVLVNRIFHDYARNCIVDEFLESDCDLIWFLDSDIVPAKHTLDLVTMHYDKWQVAGCPYPILMSIPGERARQIVFTAYKGLKDGKAFYPAAIPYEGVEYVDALATGCIFIKKEVFAKLEKPYFEFKFSNEQREVIEGEDLGFFLKLSQLGIRPLTDYSMVCKHYKTNIELLEMNSYALDFAHKAVTNYATEAKKAAEEARKKMQEVKKNKSPLITGDIVHKMLAQGQKNLLAGA